MILRLFFAGLFLGSASLARADLFGEAEERGRLVSGAEDHDRDLQECSGIVASRRSPGILWMHNDSFKTSAYVMAFDVHARFVRRYKILDDPKGDFEDITLGVGPERGVDYVYLGNIGDNPAQVPRDFTPKRPPRENIKIHRFREPAGIAPGDDVDLTREVTTITLQYPDGPHNAEAMMIDPEGNLYIVLKEPSGRVFGVKRGVLDSYTGGIVKLEQVATICPQYVLTNLHMGPGKRKIRDGRVYGMTGGDISPDGSMILIKNMWESFIWFTRDAPTPENPWSRWAATLSPHGPLVQEPREALIRVPPLVPDTEQPTDVGRGEAIGFSADGNGYFTAKEGKGVMLYYYAAKTRAPVGLRVRTGEARVELSWEATAGDVTAYQIERRVSETAEFTRVGETAAGVARFEVRGVPRAGEAWAFRVRAKTREGYSAFSAVGTVGGVGRR